MDTEKDITREREINYRVQKINNLFYIYSDSYVGTNTNEF